MGVIMAFHAEPGRTPSTADLPIRLSLKPNGQQAGGAGGSVGTVDGAWWPRSRDTLIELPELVRALGETLGTVSMIAIDPDGWLPGPHRVGIGDQVISVSRSERQSHTVLLVGLDRRQLVLVVIPPETPAKAGEAALRIAGDGRSSLGAGQILANGWLVGNGPRRND
jgi:hypothetical protein